MNSTRYQRIWESARKMRPGLSLEPCFPVPSILCWKAATSLLSLQPWTTSEAAFVPLALSRAERGLCAYLLLSLPPQFAVWIKIVFILMLRAFSVSSPCWEEALFLQMQTASSWWGPKSWKKIYILSDTIEKDWWGVALPRAEQRERENYELVWSIYLVLFIVWWELQVRLMYCFESGSK